MKYQTPGDTRVGVETTNDGLTHFFRTEPGDARFWVSLCKVKVVSYMSDKMVMGYAFDENELAYFDKKNLPVIENMCEKCLAAYKDLWRPSW
jgi:hypothetical protein